MPHDSRIGTDTIFPHKCESWRTTASYLYKMFLIIFSLIHLAFQLYALIIKYKPRAGPEGEGGGADSGPPLGFFFRHLKNGVRGLCS